MLVTRPVCRFRSRPASGRPAGAAIKQLCRNHRYEERSPYHENSPALGGDAGIGGFEAVPATRAGRRHPYLPAASCALICGKYLEVPTGQAKGMLNGIDMSSLLDQVSASRLTYIRTVTVNGLPAWQLRASDGSTVYVAQGPPYPLRLTKGPSRADFTQWNSLTSSPPWKGEDSSRDLRSRCRFAVHSRALVRKKAPRAATTCPAAVPCWILHVARLALADRSRLPRYINISFETRRTRFLPGLKAGHPRGGIGDHSAPSARQSDRGSQPADRLSKAGPGRTDVGGL